MNDKVKQAACELIERVTDAGLAGTIAEVIQLQQINRDLNGKLPDWHAELLSTFPLCGVELGWQDEDDISWIIWSTPEQSRSESLDVYPGLAILQRGYINVALCAHGSGNAYFIPTHEGENSPIYLSGVSRCWRPARRDYRGRSNTRFPFFV